MNSPDTPPPGGDATGKTPKPRRVRGRRRRLLFRFCRRVILAGLILFLILVGVVWFSRDWIIAESETLVNQQLANRGIYLTYEDPSFHLVRGVVFRNVALFESETKDQPVLELSHAAFDVSLQRLLRERAVNAQFHIRDATATFYSGEPAAEVTELNTDLQLTSEGLELREYEMLLNGMRYQGSGVYLRDVRDIASAEDDEDTAREKRRRRGLPDFAFLGKFREWGSFDSGHGDAPVFRFKFRYDPVAETPLQVQGRLSGKNVSWRGVALDKLDVDIVYERPAEGRGSIQFPKAELGYRGQSISGKIAYHLDAKRLAIDKLQSSVDWLALYREPSLGGEKRLSFLSVSTPPKFTVAGAVPVDEIKRMDIDVEITEGGVMAIKTGENRSLEVSNLKGKAEFAEGRVSTDGLSARLLNGTLVTAGTMTVLRGGEAAREGTFNVHFDHQEQSVAGEVAVNFDEKTVSLAGLHSTADWLAIYREPSLGGPEALPMIQIEAPPDLTINGTIPFSKLGAMNLTAAIQSGGAMWIKTAEDRSISVRDLQGTVTFREGVVASESLTGSVLGGQASAAGKMTVLGEARPFQVDLSVQRIPLRYLVNASGSESELPGTLDGQASLSSGGALETLDGSGSVKVDDARFFAVPVLGPLYDVLGNVAPIFGDADSQGLRMTFQIDDGVVTTNDLVVDGGMTHVAVDGNVDLKDKSTGFSAQAKVDGPVGLATGLVSKLLEIEGSGPINDVNWRLKTLTMGGAADIVGDGVDLGTRTVTQGGKVILETGQKGVRTATEGVKKIGQGLGSVARMIPGFGRKDDEENEDVEIQVEETPSGEAPAESSNTSGGNPDAETPAGTTQAPASPAGS